MSEPFRVRQWAKDAALADCMFVIASFEFDEPLICGFAPTLAGALQMAGNLPPKGAVICNRVLMSSEMLWRDSFGREVRSEHFRSSIKQGEYQVWR